MTYETFEPHADLSSVVKCHWTLEVPADMQAPKQRIIPDGCLEMCFILGDDIKRFTSENDFIIQPRAMVVGQITKPYYVQPTGYVHSFSVRFYPYGIANFIQKPLCELADKETPITLLFEDHIARELETQVIKAPDTAARIEAVENFLLGKLTSPSTIDHIVRSTIDSLSRTKGNASISSILRDDPTKRRNLERNFSKQVGISPKQLGRIIRLQAALKLLLDRSGEKLTQIAYDSEYYDQAHFIKDFKELTGTNPKDYLNNDQMILSSLFYTKD